MAVPLYTPDSALAARIVALESQYRPATDAVMARTGAIVAPYGGSGMPQIWDAVTQSYREPTRAEYDAELFRQLEAQIASTAYQANIGG